MNAQNETRYVGTFQARDNFGQTYYIEVFDTHTAAGGENAPLKDRRALQTHVLWPDIGYSICGVSLVSKGVLEITHPVGHKITVRSDDALADAYGA